MKKTFSLNNTNYAFMLVALLIGLCVGYVLNGLSQPKSASAQEIEQAKNEISTLYKDKAVDACWRVNNGANLATDKYELTYRNIKINNATNRAVITDCAENSTLLAKNSHGQWVETTVNITSFGRINPTWQKECNIADITVADDQIRPENGSIDEMNLEECKRLNQQ